MPLSIKNPNADRLARELARRQNKTITEALVDALNLALDRERRRLRKTGMAEDLMGIAQRYSEGRAGPYRNIDEILAYSGRGLPE